MGIESPELAGGVRAGDLAGRAENRLEVGFGLERRAFNLRDFIVTLLPGE